MMRLHNEAVEREQARLKQQFVRHRERLAPLAAG
jgi:hypothetical protein